MSLQVFVDHHALRKKKLKTYMLKSLIPDLYFFSVASRAAQHVAPPPGIVEIDSEKFACQW